MAIEVGISKPRKSEFVLDGVELYIRKMPLRVALKLQQQGTAGGIEVAPDLVADTIHECTVTEAGKPAFASPEAVLNSDWDVMSKLFAAISIDPGEADTVKN